MIDRQAEQGYTVWKVKTFANSNRVNSSIANEGDNAWNNVKFFIDPKAGFWQNIDERIQYFSSKGVVTSLVQEIGLTLKDAFQTLDCERLTVYNKRANILDNAYKN